MNVKLKKNLEELSFLLQYFQMRMDSFREEGVLKPGFEEFVSECSDLARKLNISLHENDLLEKKLESKAVPVVENLDCPSCGENIDTSQVTGTYRHSWGWESNEYTCGKCGENVRGIQPNNLEDLIMFPNLCEKHMEETDTLGKTEREQLLTVISRLSDSVKKFRQLNQLLLNSIEQKREVEQQLEKRIEEYCSILLVEKYRLETGNPDPAEC